MANKAEYAANVTQQLDEASSVGLLRLHEMCKDPKYADMKKFSSDYCAHRETFAQLGLGFKPHQMLAYNKCDAALDAVDAAPAGQQAADACMHLSKCFREYIMAMDPSKVGVELDVLCEMVKNIHLQQKVQLIGSSSDGQHLGSVQEDQGTDAGSTDQDTKEIPEEGTGDANQ